MINTEHNCLPGKQACNDLKKQLNVLFLKKTLINFCKTMDTLLQTTSEIVKTD